MRTVTHANPPASCDLCGSPIIDEFVDGVTKMGPWANMDLVCFNIHGRGLGLGIGQRYRLIDDKFTKVEG